MPRFKWKYGAYEQAKRKSRIKEAASIEEFSSSLQASAGLRTGSKRAAESVSSRSDDQVRAEMIDFVVGEALDIIDTGKIFFSPEPETALAELRELLADEEVVEPVVRELTRVQKSNTERAESAMAYEEYRAEIDAGKTPNPEKYAKYLATDNE